MSTGELISGAIYGTIRSSNEGFKEQKIGYGLEHHCNCKYPGVMWARYLLLQIAHTFMQLLARSNLLGEPVESLRHLAATLLESLRNHLLLQSTPDMRLPPMQIRFAKAAP